MNIQNMLDDKLKDYHVDQIAFIDGLTWMKDVITEKSWKLTKDLISSIYSAAGMECSDALLDNLHNLYKKELEY